MATDTDITTPAGPPPLPTKAAKPQPDQSPTPATKVVDAKPGEIAIEPINLDTPESDAAIADIVAQEADQVLAAEDAGISAAQQDADTAPPEAEKHGHPIFWFVVVLLVILAAIAAYVLMNPDLDLPFSA